MSQIPENLSYTASHEWIEEGATNARMGITDHAQQRLGDLVFIELPEIGREVALGEELGVLESVKAAADFYAPVSGVVAAVNQSVVDNPALVNQDPYGKGWLVALTVKDHGSKQTLLTPTQYHETMNGES